MRLDSACALFRHLDLSHHGLAADRRYGRRVALSPLLTVLCLQHQSSALAPSPMSAMCSRNSHPATQGCGLALAATSALPSRLWSAAGVPFRAVAATP